MINKPGDDRVVGDFSQEMERRTTTGRRRRWIALLSKVAALTLLWYSIQPLALDVWHQVAFIVGVLGLVMIAEWKAYYLADDIDVLEEQIAKRLNVVEEEHVSKPGKAF